MFSTYIKSFLEIKKKIIQVKMGKIPDQLQTMYFFECQFQLSKDKLVFFLYWTVGRALLTWPSTRRRS